MAQLGARLHYGVPRALLAGKLLERLYTDVYASAVLPRIVAALPRRAQPGIIRRLAGRRSPELPSEYVTAFTGFGLNYKARLSRARSLAESDAAHVWAGRRFGQLVAQGGFAGASGVYAFNTAALEVHAAAKSHGLRAVLEQTIAPRQLEEQLLAEEREVFPDWEPPAAIRESTRVLMAREAQEWQIADLIVCGSKFVSEGIAACAGPVNRCVIIPYGVDADFLMPPRPRRAGPLRVLTVGRVGLRKGSPYVAAAARRLAGRIEVRMVGPLDLPAAAAARLAEAVTLTGAVPRSDMRAQLAWADVFLLPSICEGSATAVYEAMTAALPVICTPNTGAVVRDGIDGIIVAPSDADAIVAALDRLACDPDLRRAMAENAARRAREHDLEAFAERLLRTLSPPRASGGRAA